MNKRTSYNSGVHIVLTARQKKILDLLQMNELLTVEELAQLLQVSGPTIRRDLMVLESDGLINRTWGGATPATSVGYGQIANERSKLNIEEKRAIAATAVNMIEEGEVIALDVGTTCIELAKLLKRFRHITVFTNGLLTAQILGNSHLTVHLIGGRLRSEEFSLVGAVARDTILRFNYDKFFMGAAGFNVENGPTDFNLDDVEVKQCFMKKSKRIITLVDHTKFGKTSLASICETEQLTNLITDSTTSGDTVDRLTHQGVHVTIASGANC